MKYRMRCRRVSRGIGVLPELFFDAYAAAREARVCGEMVRTGVRDDGTWACRKS